MQSIVLGGGCFWCVEAVFSAIDGVQSAISGYMGGEAQTANYEAVCTGESEHVEVVKITFDEQIIDLSEILTIFFAMHDPTTPNRQGNDIGTQYASVIFVNDEQETIAKQKLDELKQQGIHAVTHILPVQEFYPAENYHQQFFVSNPSQPYCHFVILPKMMKLKTEFGHLLR